jgi:uncharacterized protein YndB with AHSA1/START domain
MPKAVKYKVNPKLDLVLQRVIDVPPKLVWKAWTNPKHLVKWFIPEPWSAVSCKIDVRPGGEFSFVMRSPEGQDFPSTGCFLKVVENRMLVWTDALYPGYRPSDSPFFTAVILLEPKGKGTKYTAIAIHNNVANRNKHDEMGFHSGWGKALDQLVALLKKK